MLRTFPKLSCKILLPVLAYLVFSFTTVVAQEEPEYRLGAGDVVNIQVWNHPELSRTTTVNRDGSLTELPDLDKPVVALNRTESELADQLTKLYRASYPEIPQVVVKVVEYKSRSVTVIGEVKNPGVYGFPVIPSLHQVLIEAGLPTSLADLARVRILRKGKGEEMQCITVDLSPMRRNEVPKSLPELLRGDQIIVPRLIRP